MRRSEVKKIDSRAQARDKRRDTLDHQITRSQRAIAQALSGKVADDLADTEVKKPVKKKTVKKTKKG